MDTTLSALCHACWCSQALIKRSTVTTCSPCCHLYISNRGYRRQLGHTRTHTTVLGIDDYKPCLANCCHLHCFCLLNHAFQDVLCVKDTYDCIELVHNPSSPSVSQHSIHITRKATSCFHNAEAGSTMLPYQWSIVPGLCGHCSSAEGLRSANFGGSKWSFAR